MPRNRLYGIKFPFTDNNESGWFIDMDGSLTKKVESEIMHVILTQKRTRLRRPDFGTDLIKFIFEDNMSGSWESVRSEIISSVSKYVPNVTITDVAVYTDENDDNSLYLDLKYNVSIGNKVESGRILTRL